LQRWDVVAIVDTSFDWGFRIDDSGLGIWN